MSATRSYRSDSIELIAQTHRQDYFGALTIAGEETHLNVIDGSVTFSEDWSPRMQTQLTVAARLGSAEMLKIDPRQFSRLEVSAGYLLPGEEPDVHVLGRGHLSHRSAKLPGDVLTLRGASSEMYLQETKWISSTLIRSFEGVTEALEWFIWHSLPGGPLRWKTSVPALYRPDLVSGIEVAAGATMWDLVDSITLSAGLRIYSDEEGDWVLEPRATLAGITRAYLMQTDTGILLDAEDIVSRDGYYTSALIKYAWTDEAGEAREILGTWAPTLPGPGTRGAGQRTYVDSRPGPVTQASANEAARLLVKNLSTRGDSYVLTAVAAYWLRDGDTVQVRLSNGVDVRHIVRSVTFNLADGSMTVTTREPSNLGLD